MGCLTRLLKTTVAVVVFVFAFAVGLEISARVVFSTDNPAPAVVLGALGLGALGLVLLMASLRLSGRGRSADDASWRDDPASAKQKSFAKNLGITFPKNITRGALSDSIDEALDKDDDDE